MVNNHEKKLAPNQIEYLKSGYKVFIERSHATAFELAYLISLAVGKEYEFNEEQENLILDYLCYKPADLQFALRSTSGISIKKY